MVITKGFSEQELRVKCHRLAILFGLWFAQLMNYITTIFVLYVATLRWKKLQLYSIHLPALPVLADCFSLCVHPDWNESILVRLRQGLIIWGDDELPVWLRCDREQHLNHTAKDSTTSEPGEVPAFQSSWAAAWNQAVRQRDLASRSAMLFIMTNSVRHERVKLTVITWQVEVLFLTHCKVLRYPAAHKPSNKSGS